MTLDMRAFGVSLVILPEIRRCPTPTPSTASTRLPKEAGLAREQLQYASGKMMVPHFQKIREILKKQLDDAVDGKVPARGPRPSSRGRWKRSSSGREESCHACGKRKC